MVYEDFNFTKPSLFRDNCETPMLSLKDFKTPKHLNDLHDWLGV